MKEIEQELQGKFFTKHLDGGHLADSYLRLGYDKYAARVLSCGTELSFKVPIGGVGPHKLVEANFCKDRLCPMCAWRRSKKVFGQISKIMDRIEKDYAFIFVTYTLRNCPAELLVTTINRLLSGFDKVQHLSALKRATKGFFRALEVTRRPDRPKSLAYHPHIHCIYAVNPSYFTSRDYIQRQELAEMWEKVNDLDYYPQVFMQKVKPKTKKKDREAITLAGAVSEVAKYSVKSADYLIGNNDYIDEAVYTLRTALSGRRLCAMGGIFKQTARDLDLDDMIDGDLVLTDNDEELRDDISYLIYHYKWHCGYYLDDVREYKENDNI